MAPLLDGRAAWRVMVDTFERLPDTEVIDREDWVQMRTPSSPTALHNRVLRARIEPHEVDATIAQVIDDHRRRDASFLWVVDDGSRPRDLPARLQAFGLRFVGEASGMVRAVSRDPPPPWPTGVRLARATRGDARRLGELRLAAWPEMPLPVASVVGWIERSFEGHLRPLQHWMAFFDHVLVGSAVLHVRPGYGYMQGGWVLPPARGRGIYSALVHERMRWLHDAGVPAAVIWANRQTSAPVAARLGFTEVGRALFFELAHGSGVPSQSSTPRNSSGSAKRC